MQRKRATLWTNTRTQATLPSWEVCVCLLLAALILYNPFLAGADSVAGLSVRHPASNRATVGASELQHFTPAEKSASLLSGDGLLLFALLIPHSLHPSGQRITTTSIYPAAVQHLAPSLWFRPPPSL
jgi:hypothetical protein